MGNKFNGQNKTKAIDENLLVKNITYKKQQSTMPSSDDFLIFSSITGHKIAILTLLYKKVYDSAVCITKPSRPKPLRDAISLSSSLRLNFMDS